MKPHEVTSKLAEYAKADRNTETMSDSVFSAACDVQREISLEFIALAHKWADAKPFLRAYAQLLWFNGQLNENAKVCALLGEKSALEHEQGEDRP